MTLHYVEQSSGPLWKGGVDTCISNVCMSLQETIVICCYRKMEMPIQPTRSGKLVQVKVLTKMISQHSNLFNGKLHYVKDLCSFLELNLPACDYLRASGI